MANTPLNNYAEEFRFFDDCCLALIANEYIEAALILEKGLNENRDKVHAVDQSDILQRFLARLILLKGEHEAGEPAPKPKPFPPVDQLRCSFCGKNKHEVQKLIAGPTVYICNECIEICNEIIRDDATHQHKGEHEAGEPAPKPLPPVDKLRCSFCGKTQHEVQKLIAGPTVYICNECIEICNEIIRDDSTHEHK